MKPSPGSPCSQAALRRQRWERIGLGIRLAYNTARPEVLRCWLGLGARLVGEGVLDEAAMLQRSLRLLLQTAQDEALPWFWRSVCLEHTARPLARTTTLLRLHDPLQAQAVQAFVQAARDRLDAVPPQHRYRRPTAR